MRRLKRCAEPLGLGWRGNGSVDVDSSTRFGCCLSSTEFLLKSLALLFVVWAFSPGQGHISNSSEVATIATGRSLTTSTLKLVGVTFFFFGLRPDTPPPSLGSGSTSRYPLARRTPFSVGKHCVLSPNCLPEQAIPLCRNIILFYLANVNTSLHCEELNLQATR